MQFINANTGDLIETKSKKFGVILAYIGQAIHMLSGLIYTPIMLRLLGQSEYGLFQLVNSIVSYLGLLSFGFSGAYMRFYSIYKKDNDKKNIEKLNGMFFIIFSIISVVSLICGTIMTLNINIFFETGLSSQEYIIAKKLMIMMVIGLTTTLFSTVFTCYATAHEQFIFQRLLEIFQGIFNPFLALPLLLMGKGSVAMVAVSTSLVILKFIANLIFCKKKLKIKFRFKNLNAHLLKEMSIFTIFIFLNQIIDTFSWSLDKLLLGKFSGTVSVAVYGVAANINLMYNSMLVSISNVFVPKINMIVAKTNDSNLLSALFAKVGRIQFMVSYLIISGYIVFGKNFIKLWAGEGYEQSYYVGLLLLIPATVELIQYLGIEIQKAKNMHKTRSVVYTLISTANIIISIPLIKHYGAIGAALGTAVSLFFGTFLFMNYYYHARIKLDMIYFWKNILKLIPSLIPSIICAILFYNFADTSTWGRLILSVCFYSLIYAAGIYFIGLNNEEKNMLRDLKLFKRKR